MSNPRIEFHYFNFIKISHKISEAYKFHYRVQNIIARLIILIASNQKNYRKKYCKFFKNEIREIRKEIIKYIYIYIVQKLYKIFLYLEISATMSVTNLVIFFF